MKKLLITGGPVHAHLDAVKIITNGFAGGLMAQLAEELATRGAEITYLCAPKAGRVVVPKVKKIEVLEHSGFDDYLKKVVDIAPRVDGVILGAAVANLIPANPWKGKFPSHDYKPGDTIPIPFTIAPRVIDEVKKVAPNTHLFGYKLLSGVDYEELIRAAYGIVLEAKATAVIANDATNLQQKFVVTKERGVHPMMQTDLAAWMWTMLNDRYYSSVFEREVTPAVLEEKRLEALVENYRNRFTRVENGIIFGTVAVRNGEGFLTTGRGKRELDEISYVSSVDHSRRKLHIGNYKKASLNAPLLAKMFENPKVDYIVHYHEQVKGLPTYSYAPPGTMRDTERPNKESFNIKEHGCMLLFDKWGKQL